MSIFRSGKLHVAAIAALAAALLALAWSMPAQAGAATAEYPGGNASTFATSNGGWTSAATYSGVCVQGVTCPEVTGSYEASGGAGGAGDGYIRANSGSLTVVSLLSTSTLTWRSPNFTYNGVNGQAPEDVKFSVGINPNVAELLDLGVDVGVTARAVAVSGGGSQVLINDVTPSETAGWQTLNGEIGPGALEVGKQYAIELSMSIGGVAAILPSGWIGFDDVSLRATKDTSGGGGNGGGNGGNGDGNGGNGKGDGNGGNGKGSGKVLPPPRNVPAGKGYYYRGRLYIRLRCPARFKPTCKMRAAAVNRLHRGRPMTRVVKRRVRTRHFKRVALVVKPRFRKRIRKLSNVRGKTLILRIHVKSKRGKRKATIYYSLRVLQRHRR